MQHLTLFVLCSQDPSCPVPLEFADRSSNQWFEDYVPLFQAVPPQVGAQAVIDGTDWLILEVNSYTTDQFGQFLTAGFHIAVCTQDGTLPEREDWHDPSELHLYELFIGRQGEPTDDVSGFQATSLANVEHLPRIGELLMDTPEWYVHAIQSFLPIGERPRQGYDQVFICWCERNPNPPPTHSDWEICPVIPPDPYLMPVRAGRSQVLFYVELTAVQNLSIAETLKLLAELGYKPQLRYREWQNSEGQREMELYALLKYEQHDFNYVVRHDYLSDELNALWQKIVPSLAVHLIRGCPPRQMVSLTTPE